MSFVSSACRKRRLNGAVSRNNRIKRLTPCWCLDRHAKEPNEVFMALGARPYVKSLLQSTCTSMCHFAMTLTQTVSQGQDDNVAKKASISGYIFFYWYINRYILYTNGPRVCVLTLTQDHIFKTCTLVANMYDKPMWTKFIHFVIRYPCQI